MDFSTKGMVLFITMYIKTIIHNFVRFLKKYIELNILKND
jgi:hypothetical protein